MRDPMQANVPLGLRRRFLAYLIDILILGFLLILFSILLLYFWKGSLLLAFAFFSQILFWLYNAVCEISPLQASLGKWLLGMKVIHEGGRKVSFLQATVRFWTKILSAATLWWGVFMIAWTENKQALHDKIAKTLVVKR